MDFKDVVVFNKKGYSAGKIVVPRNAIKGLTSSIEMDYSSKENRETAIIHIDVEAALNLGFDTKEINLSQKVVPVPLTDSFSAVLGLLQGSAAANVLFGDSK